ncbi:gp97 [Mycobacterium phage Omega]|uniref:Uncharacterized protein n=1 Tax=Mycobacterium phage Omega TaxID=2907835 RepID=Q854G9_BPMOM|nr:gp97 [Mycobacterium phage Omega]AAN12739.1 hypothetical protein PBI_OMEGA_97 [Mycobacterium phage Omega]
MIWDYALDTDDFAYTATGQQPRGAPGPRSAESVEPPPARTTR